MHLDQILKKFVFVVGIIFVSVTLVSAQNINQTAEEFGLRIKEIVLKGDRERFRQLLSYLDQEILDDDIEYLFGFSLLKKKSTRIKIFGPYSFSKKMEKANYTLIFYDPKEVHFEKNKLDETQVRIMMGKAILGVVGKNHEPFYTEPEVELNLALEGLWGAGFLETRIIKVGGKWKFYGDPFYFNSHAPWVGDYG